MHVRKEGRNARNGYVSGENIELWDTVPSCAFRGEHVNQEDFGFDVLVTPPSFEDRQRLRNCHGHGHEHSQKLTGTGDGTHIDGQARKKPTEMFCVGRAPARMGGELWVLSMAEGLDLTETADRLAQALADLIFAAVLAVLAVPYRMAGRACTNDNGDSTKHEYGKCIVFVSHTYQVA